MVIFNVIELVLKERVNNSLVRTHNVFHCFGHVAEMLTFNLALLKHRLKLLHLDFSIFSFLLTLVDDFSKIYFQAIHCG